MILYTYTCIHICSFGDEIEIAKSLQKDSARIDRRTDNQTDDGQQVIRNVHSPEFRLSYS